MITYTVKQIPFWKLKDGYDNLPNRVSFFGSSPQPIEAYSLEHKPSIEINDNGKITYSNYFFGKIIKTYEEAIEIVKKLK